MQEFRRFLLSWRILQDTASSVGLVSESAFCPLENMVNSFCIELPMEVSVDMMELVDSSLLPMLAGLPPKMQGSRRWAGTWGCKQAEGC